MTGRRAWGIGPGVLLVWAWAGPVQAQPPAAGGVCEITRYGAVADDDRLDTAAVQAAVDACARAGGGRVAVPPGRFVIGTIHLRSRLELHLAAGAVLQGSADIADYPVLSDVRGDDHSLPRSRDARPGGEDAHGRGNVLIAGHPTAPLERLRLEGIDLLTAAPVDLAGLAGKPRGNALLSALPDSVDYARTNAHVTVAHAVDLDIIDLRARGASPADSGARHAVWLKEVDGARLAGVRTDTRAGSRAAIVIDGGGGQRFDRVEVGSGSGPVFQEVSPPRR